MSSPENIVRFRRLRRTTTLRQLMRENSFSLDDLIMPVFVEENISARVAIESMPGIYRYPETQLADYVRSLWHKGIKAILLFGISHHKDKEGSDTWNPLGLMARMIRIAKSAAPQMLVISDNCFCEYTLNSHCGTTGNREVDNDKTLANLQKQVVVAAQAGVDMIAPSGMVDGMVAAIRTALNAEGFTHIPIMSYSSKFSSSFYGPFRDAVDSGFKGTRDAYQMDCANAREAIAESLQDEAEGADILMVKPGMAYLDILYRIREASLKPLAVYQVSGEYSMIKLAAAAGVLDERAVITETLLAFKRAGADLIISYFTETLAEWIGSSGMKSL